MMRLILMPLSSLLLVGCATTYELSPVPPGHPASTRASEAPVERSRTLAHADPVEPQVAQSEHWIQRDEAGGHGEHGQMMPGNHEASGPAPESAPNDHAAHDATETRPHAEHDMERPDEAEGESQAAFETQVGELLRTYFNVAGALAEDDFDAARQAMEQAQTQLNEANPEALDEAQRQRWAQLHEPLSQSINRFLAAGGMEPARTAFAPLSEQFEQMVRRFGSGEVASVHLMHCPMAFGNRGANWLQSQEQVNNPYYGARMLRCGEVTETIVQDDPSESLPEQDQEQKREPSQGGDGHKHH